jgi:uncharacterized membrane protein HdeD (DUF308 family)
VTSASTARTFEVRHVQVARAAFAAIAAVMITFSSDHSAVVGLAVFSGFALATGLVWMISAWLVYPAGQRWPAIALGVIAIVAGMAGGLGPLRTEIGFFGIVAAWALISGIVEAIAGWQGLRGRTERRDIAPGVADTRPLAEHGPRSESRDAVAIGALSVILGIALIFIPSFPALDYSIGEVDQTFTLTGIIIGVGVFGGYAAIVAVYLGIAGFSPRKAPVSEVSRETATDESSTA